MTEDSITDWTELHFLPQLQDFQPDLDAVRAWLSDWGLDRVDAALAFGSADEWDDDNFDLLADEEDLPLDDVGGFLDREDVVSAHLLLDPGPCELVPMMRAIAEGCRGQWTPCAATVTLGARSIPDLNGEQTAARAHCSFIIGGPGALNKPLKSMQVIQSQDYCQVVCQRLQDIWQQPVRCLVPRTSWSHDEVDLLSYVLCAVLGISDDECECRRVTSRVVGD